MSVTNRNELQSRIDEKELDSVDPKEIEAVAEAIDTIRKHCGCIRKAFADLGSRADREEGKEQKFVSDVRDHVIFLCGVSEHLSGHLSFRLMRNDRLVQDTFFEALLHMVNMFNHNLKTSISWGKEVLSSPEFSVSKYSAVQRICHDMDLIAAMMSHVLTEAKSVLTVQHLYSCVIDIPELEYILEKAAEGGRTGGYDASLSSLSSTVQRTLDLFDGTEEHNGSEGVTDERSDPVSEKNKSNDSQNLLSDVFQRADEIAASTPRGRPAAGSDQHPKSPVRVRVDDDVIDWLKGKNPKYTTQINAYLRALKEAEEAAETLAVK